MLQLNETIKSALLASSADRRCRIRAYEHDKPMGFICPGGKINRLKVHASLLTRANAEKAKSILDDKPECAARGLTFKIIED